MQNGSISCQINQLYPAISPKCIFRKRNRRIQRTNTNLKSSNNSVVNMLTRDISLGGRSSPLFWLFFSLPRCALSRMWEGSWDWFSIVPGPVRVSGFLWHCSKWACQFVFGIFSIRQGFRCQHVALCIVPNGPTSSYSGSSVYIRAWSVSMLHRYRLKLWQNLNVFRTGSEAWNGRETANRVILTLNMGNSTTLVRWYSVRSLYFAFKRTRN